jgi:hypothetical protein
MDFKIECFIRFVTKELTKLFQNQMDIRNNY